MHTDGRAFVGSLEECIRNCPYDVKAILYGYLPFGDRATITLCNIIKTEDGTSLQQGLIRALFYRKNDAYRYPEFEQVSLTRELWLAYALFGTRPCDIAIRYQDWSRILSFVFEEESMLLWQFVAIEKAIHYKLSDVAVLHVMNFGRSAGIDFLHNNLQARSVRRTTMTSLPVGTRITLRDDILRRYTLLEEIDLSTSVNKVLRFREILPSLEEDVTEIEDCTEYGRLRIKTGLLNSLLYP